MTEITWITPRCAERLVASYIDAANVPSVEAMAQLCSWAAQEQLKTMALEATWWIEDRSKAVYVQPRPAPSQPSKTDDGKKVAYRVNAAYHPPSTEQPRLSKTIQDNYALSSEDWFQIMGGDSDLETIWTASEINLSLHDERHPHARVFYSGLRMAKEDVERRIDIAGWTKPSNIGEPDGFLRPQASASDRGAGRAPANWWPDFAEELAVYLHEEGLPVGDGQRGQAALMEGVFRRLVERGKTEPSRTTVQPVIRAVLSRLRTAGNATKSKSG